MIETPALHHIDLNLLYTLHTVVDAGGVAAAAKRLGRTQPAISARLRHLEEELEVKLFERIGRKLALTPAGRIIDAEVREVLSGIRRVLDHARSTDQSPTGTLRIGALPTVSAYVVGPAVPSFLRRFPRAGVSIRLGLTRSQLDELRSGDLDVVVSVGPMPREELHVVKLADVRAMLAMRKRGAPAGTVRLSRLRGLDLIGFGSVGDLFFDSVWQFLGANRLEANMRTRVAHIQTIKGMIAAGGGVSILPGYTVVESQLVARKVEKLSLSLPMWAAARRSARNVPLVAEFCDHLRKHVRA